MGDKAVKILYKIPSDTTDRFIFNQKYTISSGFKAKIAVNPSESNKVEKI